MKYSAVLQNQEQQTQEQQIDTFSSATENLQQPEPSSSDRQEVKYSTILEQQLSSVRNEQQTVESQEENPYLRYTQHLSAQNTEDSTATDHEMEAQPATIEREIKYSHVLEQEERRKESETLHKNLIENSVNQMTENVSLKEANNQISSLPSLSIEPVAKTTNIKQEPQTASSPSPPPPPPDSVPSPPKQQTNIKAEKPDPVHEIVRSQPSPSTASLPSSISLRPIHTLMQSTPQMEIRPSRPEMSLRSTRPEMDMMQSRLHDMRPQMMMRPTRPERLMTPTRPQMMMRPTRPDMMLRTTSPKMMMRPTRPGMMMRSTRPEMMMRTTRPEMMMRSTRPQMMMRPMRPQMMMRMQQFQPPEIGLFQSQGLVRAPVSSGLLSPNQLAASRPLRAASPSGIRVYVCSKCGAKFPFPEPNPETHFMTNFSCHVLFNHLRAEVVAEMGCDDLEVCPADDCPYNIVQLKEDGVPDAESFLIKHYISRHLEVLMPLIHENPVYSHEACLKTVEMPPSEARQVAPKTAGLPNQKLKPIFLDKYFKFARNVAKCPVPAECDPIHVVVFLNQWVSRRNYSIAGINVLLGWISEVHSLIDSKPLHLHPRLEEFINQMETRLSGETVADNKPLIDTKRENEFYGDVITNPFDIIKATTCPLCNDKFQHTTKLLYHMLHLHKVNPVHFINKNLRAKPVR